MWVRCLFVVALIALAAPAAVGWAASPIMFYVAPGGSDDNPGTEAKPFASIEKARQAVRAVNREMTHDIVVVLGGGTYRIDRSLVFDAEDSGFHGHRVVYRAQAGQSPVISGGRPVLDWQPDAKGRWKAASPCDDFRQLYVGGIRATRAKGAPPTELELAGDDGYQTAAVEMAAWRNPADIEFCYQVAWTHTRSKVAEIRRQGDRAVVTMLQPFFAHARAKDGVQVNLPDSIENALELLDEPGEWYLDRAAKTVYYLPRAGENMRKVEVIAPALQTLVELRGTLDRPVHDLQFSGITFQHGTWLQPSRLGFVDVQANFTTDSDRRGSQTSEGAGGVGFGNKENEWFKMPANVVCHAATAVRFDRCTFRQLGGAGLDLEFGSRDCVVAGCRFAEIAGTAVQVGDVLHDDHHPDDPRKIVRNNAVENCYIHDCCADYWGGVGVFVGYTEATRIVHNEICRLPYAGVSLGWGWGEQDAVGQTDNPHHYQAPTPSRNNRVEYNYIHTLATVIDCGVGIHTLGNMPGTILRGNHIHNSDDPASRGKEASGIWLNTGSGGIEVTSNYVHDLPMPASYSNEMPDRLATCREHGNFLGGTAAAAEWIAENAGLEGRYRDLLKPEPAR
jgi:hypothetical protein